MSKSYISIGVFILSFVFLIPIAGAQTPLYFGWSSVTPGVADFNGDGFYELGLYDTADGTIYVRTLCGDELTFGLVMTASGFALALADFDGDGLSDLGSYDHDTGAWYAWCSRSGYQLGSIQCAAGSTSTTPHPANYDGDQFADPALYDSATGAWIVYLSASGYQPVSFILGGNGATAVPADYDGDRKTDPCVYDQTNGLWMALCSASQYAPTWVVYGGPGCAPAPADFDGDQKADPTIYCAALGVWGTLNSDSDYAPNLFIQGGPGCVPKPGNYYLTDRADYALYNTTNGGWYISYEGGAAGPEVKIAIFLAQTLFSKSSDWTLFSTKKFKEGQAILDTLVEANQKLDTLLINQAAIQIQLQGLILQLHYESEKTRLLIEGLSAKDAISTIKTYYDYGGPDGYATFYKCDTNNMPSTNMIMYFANAVVANSVIKKSVTTIHDAILPATLGNGLLRQWVALAAFNTLTPTNLPDHLSAFSDYFMYLYAYQMKGACMYVDAWRTFNTNEEIRVSTYTYLTNDVMNMIQEEVDEYRKLTYDIILSAINAGYNPLATNNPLEVSNVSEAFSSLEFCSRQWLGQPQRLCATFLAINPLNNAVADIKAVDTNAVEHAVLVVTTNWAKGRAYGYLSSNQQYVVVDDNYAFLRYDFGTQPCGPYTIKRGTEILGTVTVSNYDDTMQPTTSTAVTNWFGHFYSPAVVQSLTIPLDDPAWAVNWYNNVTYYPWTTPYDFVVLHGYIKYYMTGPNSFANWNARLKVTVNEYECWNNGKKAMNKCGWNPWIHAFRYPITISNSTGRAISARAYITVANASAYTERFEQNIHVRLNDNFPYWSWDIYGFAQFDLTGQMAKWAEWKGGGTHRFKTHDRVSYACADSREALCYTTIPTTATTTWLYVGGRIRYSQDVLMQCVNFESVGIINLEYKINKIQLSFY